MLRKGGARAWPNEAGWSFHCFSRAGIEPEGVTVAVFLGAQAGGGCKVVRDNLERRAVVFFHHSALYKEQEKSPPAEHCVLMTRCDPSGKVRSGSKLIRLIGGSLVARLGRT